MEDLNYTTNQIEVLNSQIKDNTPNFGERSIIVLCFVVLWVILTVGITSSSEADTGLIWKVSSGFLAGVVSYIFIIEPVLMIYKRKKIKVALAELSTDTNV